ncbi:hypothetical protein ACWKW6_10385 [Dyadobacter jiangsuensis]
MNRLSSFVIVLLTFASCRTTVPLRGSYQETPVKTKYTMPFNPIWEAVIDFISDTGQEVQLIDKESGLVISDQYTVFGKHISMENAKGKIINTDAWVVSARHSDDNPKGNLKETHTASVKWTIRIKQVADETVIAVLMHVKNVYWGLPQKWTFVFDGVSTGNYEKYMLNEINARISKANAVK